MKSGSHRSQEQIPTEVNMARISTTTFTHPIYLQEAGERGWGVSDSLAPWVHFSI